MVDRPDGDFPVEDTWLPVTEAAEKTGYNRSHVQKLARDNWNLPETERTIRVQKAQFGYLVWLPDLVRYIADLGRGPHLKRTN